MSQPSPQPLLAIRVRIVPPEMYKNANQEQEFWLPITSGDLHTTDKFPGVKVLNVMVPTVPVGPPMVQMKEKSEEMLTNKPVKMTGALGEKLDKLNKAARVPIVMHNADQTILLTAFNGDKEMWNELVAYPGGVLPAAPKASTWKLYSEGEQGKVFQKLKCSLKYEEMISEPWEFSGGENAFVLKVSTKGSLGLCIWVQRVQNAKSKEPMTFFIDRTWGLKKLSLAGGADLFAPLR